MSTYPNGTLIVDPHGNYDYRPSLGMNSALLALFALSLVLHFIQGIKYRTWSFFAALVLGNITEIIGYVGRVMSYHDVHAENPFLIQICCLTIAPAFIAAGIYLSLSRLVIIFGTQFSRIKPQRYTQIFIACDFVSLVLQGAGGGIASVTSSNGEDPQTGTNIMVAGLASQVFTLALFMVLCAEYAWRVWSGIRNKSINGGQLDPLHEKLRASRRFQGFLGALTLSTVCIMIRSIYRLIELSQGWNGELISNETYFFILEGVMVIIAVLALNLFHPGWCLADSYNIKDTLKKSGDSSRSDVELGSTVRD